MRTTRTDMRVSEPHRTWKLWCAPASRLPFSGLLLLCAPSNTPRIKNKMQLLRRPVTKEKSAKVVRSFLVQLRSMALKRCEIESMRWSPVVSAMPAPRCPAVPDATCNSVVVEWTVASRRFDVLHVPPAQPPLSHKTRGSAVSPNYD